jgi:hypothetical protein
LTVILKSLNFLIRSMQELRAEACQIQTARPLVKRTFAFH